MAQQVHCSRRILFQRGLEFHVCTINKSAHAIKSGNLFNDPRIYYLLMGQSLTFHFFSTILRLMLYQKDFFQNARIREFIIRSKSLSPKVNLIAQLEFELTYYNVAVQHISHYTTETPHFIKFIQLCKKITIFFFSNNLEDLPKMYNKSKTCNEYDVEWLSMLFSTGCII